MAFRWVESFGENESYIKCLVPDVTYSSLADMITDFQGNGITVDNVGDKEKTDLSSTLSPSGEFILSNGNKYFNRTGTNWYMSMTLSTDDTYFTNVSGYSPNGRFITIGVDDEVQKAVFFDSYPSTDTSTSVRLRSYFAVTTEVTLQQAYQWINGAETPTSEVTTTEFKLWIKGLDAPTYKLNWHNEALENDNFDFSNSKIYAKLSSDSGSAFLTPFKEISYNDSSIKFTWYDMDNEAQTNIFYPWLDLLLYAVYVDENGEEHESGYCHIKLRQKSNSFDSIYELGEQGNDGSIITVVNYDDDPSGFDEDEDDYHDPTDNEDDTPDDSTNVSVSG